MAGGSPKGVENRFLSGTQQVEPGGAIIAAEIRGERVDCEGEVLESFATKTRDKAAVLKFIRKALKRHGRPTVGGLRRMEAARRLTMSPLP